MTERMTAAEYRAGAAKVPTEEQECTWLFEWARATRWRGIQIAEVLVHVPNGAYLGADPKTRAITMGKLKAMGLQPGVFDYIVPVPTTRVREPGQGVVFCPGLWLEMKRTKGGTVSQDQKEFRQMMEFLGWQCEVAKGWIQATRIIQNYLQQIGGK